MSSYQYISPADQPKGVFRLIDWIESNFLSNHYNIFKCLVAFAKIKPFYKLHTSIQKWRSRGNHSEAVIGIDHKGTSYQALQYVFANFDSVNILHADYSTFHPKLYIFQGPKKATAYYGSSNFTTGGLETNFEGGVIIDYIFPEDQAEFNALLKSYNSVALMSSITCLTPLTLTKLNDLKSSGVLLDESQKQKVPRDPVSLTSHPVFRDFIIKPARPIPRSVMAEAAASAGIDTGTKKTSKTKSRKTEPIPSLATTKDSSQIVIPVLTDGFVIQVIPHHNGEILLSKAAIEQNKPFFGFPFTGKTIPKKAGNPTYPQREPDPIVNIGVFNSTGMLVNTEENYHLNTIYYEKKSEIRITITPSILNALDVASITTNYPILVMRLSTVEGCDYDLDFYKDGSQAYRDYLSVCDQTLPSGGKQVPRKMGWI